jgi:hypothetical protein
MGGEYMNRKKERTAETRLGWVDGLTHGGPTVTFERMKRSEVISCLPS